MGGFLHLKYQKYGLILAILYIGSEAFPWGDTDLAYIHATAQLELDKNHCQS